MKKILAMVLSIALIATIAITGSVAYFTDTDSDTNVFTVGNVVIDQREWERKDQSQENPANNLQEFTQEKSLFPVYGTNTSKITFTTQTRYQISMPNESSFHNYVDKIVDVENKGKSDAYIRTIFAVPTAGMHDHAWLHLDWNETAKDSAWTLEPVNGTTTIDGAEYKLYVVTYVNPIYGSDSRKSDTAKNAYSAPSLLGVYMDSAVDFNAEKDADGKTQYNTDGSVKGSYVMGDTKLTGDLNGSKILVATQAVQVAGFDDVPTPSASSDNESSVAYNAKNALKEAFGDISKNNHPWVSTDTTNWKEYVATEYDNKETFYIRNAAEMKAFADMVNYGGTTFSDKTIVLVNDIDMSGIDWYPIGQTQENNCKYYTSNQFYGTFDGNNKTISNLSVTHWEKSENENDENAGANYASGLFGFIDLTGATIKNVTLDNATVEGHHWCGALVGFTSTGSTITNCHVKNSTIVNTHLNGGACGDKTGALIGYTTSPVSGCSAISCTVKSGRDAGQLIGATYENNATECSANEVIVEAITGCTGANIKNDALIGRTDI